MKTRDLTDLALRNLRESILRNTLTTLGVAVGVASFVAIISIGVGLQQLAPRRLVPNLLVPKPRVPRSQALFGNNQSRRDMAAGLKSHYELPSVARRASTAEAISKLRSLNTNPKRQRGSVFSLVLILCSRSALSI